MSGSIFLGKSFRHSFFAQHSFFTDKSQEKPLSKDLQSPERLVSKREILLKKLFFLDQFRFSPKGGNDDFGEEGRGCAK